MSETITTARVLAELTSWFGAAHTEAITSALTPYTEIWGDDGANCRLDDARYAVHAVVCDRTDDLRLLWAYNHLAEYDIYPGAAERLVCRHDHSRVRVSRSTA